MSKRRRKMSKKKRGQMVDTTMQASALFGFLAVIYITKSWKIALACSVSAYIITGLIFIGIKRKRNSDLKKSGIEEIDSMDGEEFEHFLKMIFSAQGYQVEVTPYSGDFGGDLILNKGRKKIVVQAKRYSNKVGVKAVQEVVSAKGYYEADEGWVVTNSKFTMSAEELAKANNIKLIERDKLIELVGKVSKEVSISIDKIREEVAIHTYMNILKPTRKCERCGSEMVVRKGKFGDFYGCVEFPECKYTESI